MLSARRTGVSRDKGIAKEGIHKHKKKPDCGQRVMRKEELVSERTIQPDS